ncbi:MAG: hypothetical protein PS018_27065 [bacterium]|nr:hypothetical protein [bacterium]
MPLTLTGMHAILVRTGLAADGDAPLRRQQFALAILIGAFIFVACLSFRMAYPYYREYYFLYDGARLPYALATVAAFAAIAPAFLYARFSFGYLTSFYFYAMVLGFLWLNTFSKFQYNHVAAGISAAASMVAYMIPAMLVTRPIGRPYELSERAFDRLLRLILLLCVVTAAIAAFYNFQIVAVGKIYDFRDKLNFPGPLNYAIGAVTTVLLPFVFACCLVRGRNGLAIASLLVMISFYPSTLSKTALFAPVWLIGMTVISRFFNTRATTILSLLLPTLAGIVLIVVIGEITRRYFDLLNVRTLMVPSNAMDIYNEYIARFELTHFCQIRFIKPFVSCSLEQPLSVEMQNIYALGNFNASLFATEGIISVGLWLAPLSVFACGLIVALGNRLSAGLPPRLILLSAGMLPLVMQNVPFSTVLLTHGLGALFLLWYLTPRNAFPKETAAAS